MSNRVTIDNIDPEGDVAEDVDGFPVHLADGSTFFVDEYLCDSAGTVRNVSRDHCPACGQHYLVSDEKGYPDDCPLCGERA